MKLNIIMLQKKSFPLEERQIHATEKFEDRPMSPEIDANRILTLLA